MRTSGKDGIHIACNVLLFGGTRRDDVASDLLKSLRSVFFVEHSLNKALTVLTLHAFASRHVHSLHNMVILSAFFHRFYLSLAHFFDFLVFFVVMLNRERSVLLHPLVIMVTEPVELLIFLDFAFPKFEIMHLDSFRGFTLVALGLICVLFCSGAERVVVILRNLYVLVFVKFLNTFVVTSNKLQALIHRCLTLITCVFNVFDLFTEVSIGRLILHNACHFFSFLALVKASSKRRAHRLFDILVQLLGRGLGPELFALDSRLLRCLIQTVGTFSVVVCNAAKTLLIFLAEVLENF